MLGVVELNEVEGGRNVGLAQEEKLTVGERISKLDCGERLLHAFREVLLTFPVTLFTGLRCGEILVVMLWWWRGGDVVVECIFTLQSSVPLLNKHPSSAESHQSSLKAGGCGGLLSELRKAIMTGIHRSSSASMKNGLPSQELLDDLCSRFVLNVPKEDLESFERILFLVEQAHWFYEDNSVEQNPSLKSLSLREFTSLMFNSCAALRPYIAHIDDIYKDFTSYKVRVPVTGAIILDEYFERCLLVKGWKVGASWSFPRGKKNKDEEDHTCAIREVLEETGFDISKLLKIDDYIEVTIGEQRVRLYIIAGVKDDTEISWHRIEELQPTGNDVMSRGANGLKLYMVGPFLTSLKSWISSHDPPAAQKSDLYFKGTCLWKAKNGSTGSTTTTESQLNRPGSETRHPDSRPGKSFRSFKFDSSLILQAMEAAFST
ncbi:NUDIX hydrolase domain [Macleaya cordata]|uniref:NUDIX hydrolase domain n=1 Tax=Macleaya cordata TaxID=56857 RepID=A0A200R5V9_MACCD|nr:NUDIX hydrolase domain [Macleaya cordata]